MVLWRIVSFPPVLAQKKFDCLNFFALFVDHAFFYGNDSLKQENAQEIEETSLLDLPELALECILERLSPPGLSNLSGVCVSLREKCTSDYLWERRMKQKWGRLIGDAAYKEWQWHTASRKKPTLFEWHKAERTVWVCFKPLATYMEWITKNGKWL